MIDDYKIKKASRMYADEVFESRKYDENHLQPHHIAFIEGNAAGFEAGAKWAVNEFINDLWHPASEEPEKNRRCLIRVVYHLNYGMLPDEERIEQSSFHDFGWFDYDFKYIGPDYDIISWLYVDDLFPKEGGEQ